MGEAITIATYFYFIVVAMGFPSAELAEYVVSLLPGIFSHCKETI